MPVFLIEHQLQRIFQPGAGLRSYQTATTLVAVAYGARTCPLEHPLNRTRWPWPEVGGILSQRRPRFDYTLLTRVRPSFGRGRRRHWGCGRCGVILPRGVLVAGRATRAVFHRHVTACPSGRASPRQRRLWHAALSRPVLRPPSTLPSPTPLPPHPCGPIAPPLSLPSHRSTWLREALRNAPHNHCSAAAAVWGGYIRCRYERLAESSRFVTSL